ncbi:hypothetical protein GF323_06675 [Candidatus Woesearchaeota archaeon]|nr:hypothetical protein [Candidatus Woesearchaeota archaeon]
MKETIRDIFLMGVGAASLTRKKAENTVRALVKKGILDNKQSGEIINRMMREKAKIQERLKKEGTAEVRKTRKKISKDINSLTRNLAKKRIKL